MSLQPNTFESFYTSSKLSTVVLDKFQEHEDNWIRTDKELNNLSRNKFNVLQSIAFLYTNNQITEKAVIKQTHSQFVKWNKLLTILNEAK